MKCRLCGAALSRTFVDLGMQPLSNAYIDPAAENDMEPFFPLHAYVCDRCLLIQLPALATPERLFSDYAYLSSMSDSWLEHCSRYAAMIVARLDLSASTLVVEVASNDGYLLRFFRERGIPVLGIEPAANIAALANKAGIPSLPRFFGSDLARELVASGKRADLLVGNNVLAHVPDLNDFVSGLAMLLAPNGVLTLEFPHLGRLLADTQFDTIYHEHFSYFTLATAEKVLLAHGLVVFDVDELPTHGGSLRVYARQASGNVRSTAPTLKALREREAAQGLGTIETYEGFGESVREVKRSLLELLIHARRDQAHVVAYGAAAKGNTLLNYCGIRTDFLDYVADRNPLKQGHLLPGSRIPVVAPERIRETRPSHVLVLPWNISEEVSRQLEYVKDWGGRLFVPIPRLQVLP